MTFLARARSQDARIPTRLEPVPDQPAAALSPYRIRFVPFISSFIYLLPIYLFIYLFYLFFYVGVRRTRAGGKQAYIPITYLPTYLGHYVYRRRFLIR